MAIVANEGQGSDGRKVATDERGSAYGEIDWVRRPDAGVKFESY